MNEQYLTGREVLKLVADGADIEEFQIKSFLYEDHWSSIKQELPVFLNSKNKFRRKQH